jgi:hypothetical protein
MLARWLRLRPWTEPALDETAIAWARGAWDALRPFATGGMYVNFSGLGDEADSAPEAVFGASQEKLTQVRATYDPGGLFAAAARRP